MEIIFLKQIKLQVCHLGHTVREFISSRKFIQGAKHPTGLLNSSNWPVAGDEGVSFMCKMYGQI